MKIQLKELDAIKQSLAKLLTAPGIPVRTAYRAQKFSKAVAKEIMNLEDARLELVKAYGKLGEDNMWRVEPKNDEVFRDEYELILEQHVDLPDVVICIDDLQAAQLSMLDVAHLDFLLVEVDPTDKHKQELQR